MSVFLISEPTGVSDSVISVFYNSYYNTGGKKMAWYVYLAYFASGIFITNGIPHFVNGISGNKFQSPFASPPGVGESSPIVNVIWGMVNIIIGYVLVYGVGDFTVGFTCDILLFALGSLVTALGLAWHFGRVRNS